MSSEQKPIGQARGAADSNRRDDTHLGAEQEDSGCKADQRA